MKYEINIPPKLIIGGETTYEAVNLSLMLGIRKPLLVSDTFISEADYTKKLIKSLKSNGIEMIPFFDVQPDPTIKNIVDGLKCLRTYACDSIIAIGGGSSLDAGKAISIMSTNEGEVKDYVGAYKFKNIGLPLIAIPTTAGTGSEVTKVIVITDTNSNTKMMLLDDKLIPTVAIVDYKNTISMPKSLTAAVGIDSLTHAIEAYVSKKANSFTNPLALSAIGLITKFIRIACEYPENEEARENMMIASNQAGIAFSNSSVCTVHGMSRPIGANFHVPHGLSNAMLLPTVTEFSISGAYDKYAKIANIMSENTIGLKYEEAAKKCVDFLWKLNKDLNIPNMKEYGIDQSKYFSVLREMSRAAINSGSPSNNPRNATEDELIELYKKAYKA